MTDEPVARLIVRTGGRVYDLGPGDWLIGRRWRSDVVIRDPSVDRNHAVLHVDEWGAELRNSSRESDCKVDGRSIGRRACLEHGMEIQIGDVVMTFSHPGSRLDRLLADHGELVRERPLPAPIVRSPPGWPLGVHVAIAIVEFMVLFTVLVRFG